MSHGSNTNQPQPHAAMDKAKRIIQAAALASSLVPLAAVAVDAAVINCVTSAASGSCSGTGSYTASGGTESNTWKFFSSFAQTQLLYTLTIEGNATTDFSLDVDDIVFTQGNLSSFGDFSAFPGVTCIPIFGGGRCTIFDVTVFGEDDAWVDGFYMTMTWFNSAAQPSNDGRNQILQAHDDFNFNFALTNTLYDPNPQPEDPALGGRGDNFSSFVPVRIPEPATLVLFGTGIAATLYRKRRRKVS